jgi:hypothetical protein
VSGDGLLELLGREACALVGDEVSEGEVGVKPPRLGHGLVEDGGHFGGRGLRRLESLVARYRDAAAPSRHHELAMGELPRITFNPKVMGGKPCIRGMRVTVSTVVGLVPPDDGMLLLTATGHPFSPDVLTNLCRGYVEKAGIGKKGACHLFRHTMATLMLEGGADVRFIQQMLGHARLDTTALYTNVSVRKLKEIHQATHPGARIGAATSEAESETSLLDGEIDDDRG